MATKTAPAHTTSITSNTSVTTTTTNEPLIFEKKNTDLLHIPHNYRVQKRPIPRAPVASPYAGSHVPKIVYISSKTPFMSAVKRVQKLLRLAERRAMTPVIEGRQARKQNSQHQRYANRAGGRGGEGDKNILEKCQQKLRQDKVLVKATGRAIEKALEVGKWFELGKGGDDEYEVVVKTGTVCVVDDIVEDEELEDKDKDKDEDHDEDKDTVVNNDNPETTAARTENNLDFESGNDATTGNEENDESRKESKDVPSPQGSSENTTTESKNQRRRRRKRERVQQQRLNAFKDEDGDPPESRTRWVNMVEIAINLK